MMKNALVLLVAASTVAACGARPVITAAPAVGNALQANAQAARPTAAPIVLKQGLALRYDITAKTGGKTSKSFHQQEIVALTATTATIKHTIPDPNGKPYTTTETVKLDPALVSSRWTSQAVLTTAIDPSLGTPAVITVKAGTFRTQKVDLHANGSKETWWFSGNVPVKVTFAGINGKTDVTAELASL
jgi:hypothetical protein